MCINSTKGRFTVDRIGKYFIFRNNLYIKKGQSVLLFTFNLIDMLACWPFRKFRKASKCFGGVNKRKISSTYRC